MTASKAGIISTAIIFSLFASAGWGEEIVPKEQIETPAKTAVTAKKDIKDSKKKKSAKTAKSTKPAKTAEIIWGNSPDFSSRMLNGAAFTLSSLKGKVILLNFWATWCTYCRKEIPDLIQLTQEYKNNGLEIVGIALEKNPDGIKEFVDEKGINYAIVVGDNELAERYNIRGIPATFIIDRNGNLVQKYSGMVKKEILETEIKKLITN